MALVLQVKNFKTNVNGRIDHNRRQVAASQNLNRYIDYSLSEENVVWEQEQQTQALENYDELFNVWWKQVEKTNEKYRKKGNYKNIKTHRQRWSEKKKSTELVLGLGDFELAGLKTRTQEINKNRSSWEKTTLKNEIQNFYKDFETELWAKIPTMKDRLVDKVIHFDEVKPHVHLTFHNLALNKEKEKVKFTTAVTTSQVSKHLTPTAINKTAINIAQKLNDKGYQVQEPKSHEANIKFFQEHGTWPEPEKGKGKSLSQKVSMNLTKEKAWRNGEWTRTERFNIREEQKQLEQVNRGNAGRGR